MDEMMNMPEMDPQEAIQQVILNAFTNSVPVEEILDMLQDYQNQFGSDMFWKMTSFDAAELTHDTDRMKMLLDSFETEDMPPIVRAISQARIDFILEDYRNAFDTLNAITSLEDSEEALMYLHIKGICAFALKDYATAVQCVEDVLMDYDDNQMTAFAAISYLHLGKNDRAKEYFDHLEENFQETDSQWLYDLIMHFHELDVIYQTEFPSALYKKLKEEADSELNASVYSLEEMIRENPDRYSDLISTRLEKNPDSHILNYLQGVLDETDMNILEAQKHYRKALTTACTAEKDASMKAANLEVRLFALDKLNYTPQTTRRHLRKMIEELADCDSCLIDLIAYCALENHPAVLDEIFRNHPMPSPRCSGEVNKLEDGMMAWMLNLREYRDAFDLACESYKNHVHDLYFIMATGYLFSIFQPNFRCEFGCEEEYGEFSRYLQDQIIRCEIGRYRHTKAFAAGLERLLERLKKDSGTSTLLDEWTLFFNYVARITEEISVHPRLQHFLGDLYDLL